MCVQLHTQQETVHDEHPLLTQSKCWLLRVDSVHTNEQGCAKFLTKCEYKLYINTNYKHAQPMDCHCVQCTINM